MASEEDVLLREVDEDLSRDKALDSFRKYRVPAAVGAIGIIGAVTAYQIMEGNRSSAADAAAEAYAPLSFASEGAVPTPELVTFSDEAGGGYATLASLRAATALAGEGDLEGAAERFERVYNNDDTSPAMRDLARIRAAYVLFDARRDEAVTIASLVETDAFRPFAEEISSLAALDSGAHAAARAGFRALANSDTAPQAVKARADAFAALADAGANGASIEPMEAAESPESFIERFGAQLEAAGVPVGESPEVPALPDLDALTSGDEESPADDDQQDGGEVPQ